MTKPSRSALRGTFHLVSHAPISALELKPPSPSGSVFAAQERLL
ncbi:hypothetical protein ABT061_03860 [Streptosporangium sp. NPDC002544]